MKERGGKNWEWFTEITSRCIRVMRIRELCLTVMAITSQCKTKQKRRCLLYAKCTVSFIKCVMWPDWSSPSHLISEWHITFVHVNDLDSESNLLSRLQSLKPLFTILKDEIKLSAFLLCLCGVSFPAAHDSHKVFHWPALLLGAAVAFICLFLFFRTNVLFQ